MRNTPAFPQVAVHGMLDQRRVLRWIWLGRVMLACAILVAAVFVWNRAEPTDTLVATLAFAGAILATVASVLWTELQRGTPGPLFVAAQCVVDLLLVTAVVHITGGWSSQFAALYILVIASTALVLSFRGGLMVAGSACLLYITDVVWLRAGDPQLGMLVQLVVFVVVAIGSGFVAARLRQAGVGRDALAAQLVKVQLEAADILRTIRSGILTIDGAGRLLYANPAASELLGINLRALIGRPVLPTLLSSSPHLVQCLERSSRDGVRTTRAEGVITREGERVEIGVTTTVADGDRPEGGANATAIFQDISDSKRIQALNVRAERLQAVAELSASLAHEIRNPLASIRSATEQLAQRRTKVLAPLAVGVDHGMRNGKGSNGAGGMHAGDFTDDADDEAVLHGLIVREADRLSRLLGDFLDFARARVQRIAAVDVGAIATSAAMLAASHPDRKRGVSVETAIEEGLPFLDGDEDLLHRAVFNLVLNAVQAVPAEGRVTLDVRRHTPSGPASDDSHPTATDGIVISVADDGPGIPAELRDSLFEPFVSGKSGGTGLGLPVVHRAVEAHHGVVIVDPMSVGARFTIHLPFHTTSSSVFHRSES